MSITERHIAETLFEALMGIIDLYNNPLKVSLESSRLEYSLKSALIKYTHHLPDTPIVSLDGLTESDLKSTESISLSYEMIRDISLCGKLGGS